MQKILSAVALSILASGCTESETLSSNQGVSFEEFKASTYREPFAGGKYIVNGDEAVTEVELKEIWEVTAQGSLIVKSSNGQDVKWEGGAQKQLTYCVSDDFGTKKADVVSALTIATLTGWELFADIDYIHLTAEDANCNAANPNVVFNVSPVSGQPYLARAFFPGMARADRQILVDASSFTSSPWPLHNIFGHELGHTLGLRHEHIRPEAGAVDCAAADGDPTGYRTLTEYDAASIMHYPQCNGKGALTFTDLDRQGIVALYGAPGGGTPGTGNIPMAIINSPAAGDTVASDFVVTASIVGDGIASVEVLVDGVSQGVKTAGPYEFPVTGIAAGDHTVDLVATGESVQVQSSINITVTGATANGAGDNSDLNGGCSSGKSGTGGAASLLLMAAVLWRRRRA
jgi:uncharacterized protein (TIGR03382 family)